MSATTLFRVVPVGAYLVQAVFFNNRFWASNDSNHSRECRADNLCGTAVDVKSVGSLGYPARINPTQFHIRNRVKVVDHAEIRHESHKYRPDGDNQ